MRAIDIEIQDLQPIIINAMKKTFQPLYGTEPVLKESSESSDGPIRPKTKRSVSGFIALVQEGRMEGTVSIGFTGEAATNLMSRLYGDRIENLDDPRLLGGISELANILHGIMKSELNAQGFSFNLNLPFVVLGSNHQCFAAVLGRSCSFDFQVGQFTVVVDIFLHRKLAD